MSWLGTLIARYPRNLHLATFVVAAAVLLSNATPVNRWVADIFLSGLYFPFVQVKLFVADLQGVAAENAKLREQLVTAQQRAIANAEAGRENIRLRSILGFTPPPGYVLVPARVVAVEGSPRVTEAMINRGGEAQVNVGQSVINEEGLVGRIKAVTARYATVELLTDPLNRVAARLASGRQMGIIKYDRESGLRLDNVPVLAPISIGDTIVTSGLGGVYPAGLLIGTVRAVDRPSEAYFATVAVDPAVSFVRLEELFVLRPSIE